MSTSSATDLPMLPLVVFLDPIFWNSVSLHCNAAKNFTRISLNDRQLIKKYKSAQKKCHKAAREDWEDQCVVGKEILHWLINQNCSFIPFPSDLIQLLTWLHFFQRIHLDFAMTSQCNEIEFKTDIKMWNLQGKKM